jgi:hypothetical protein
MVMPISRADVLRKLLECSSPLEEIAAELRNFPSDSEERVFVVTAAHLRIILDRFLSGDLTAQQVERWANLIECREDIEFEGGRFGEPREVLNELANPLLTEPLSKDSAVRMRHALARQTI